VRLDPVHGRQRDRSRGDVANARVVGPYAELCPVLMRLPRSAIPFGLEAGSEPHSEQAWEVHFSLTTFTSAPCAIALYWSIDRSAAQLTRQPQRDDVGAANRNFFRFWAQSARCGTTLELHNLCTTSYFPQVPIGSLMTRIGTGYGHPDWYLCVF
jgi:hypothetical protein